MTSNLATDAHFSEMSWHDNHVHGFRVVEGPHGSGELILDIDHILEWLSGPEGYRFRIQPSTLRFLGVSDLRVSLDYAAISAAMAPFSIHSIERSVVQRPRYEAQLWTINLNFPDGQFVFEATGYEQSPWGKVVVTPQQLLSPGERVGV
jgi:hypothetical protein